MWRSGRDHRRYRQRNEPIEDPDSRLSLIPADEGHRLQRDKGYLQNSPSVIFLTRRNCNYMAISLKRAGSQRSFMPKLIS